MKKSEMKEMIRSNGGELLLLKIQFRYDTENRYFIPIATGDKLFLSAEDIDFEVDGFTIRRYKDIEKVKNENGKYAEIYKAEGIAANLDPPAIDLTNWYTVMGSLYDLDKNIIIETEPEPDKKRTFFIGRIEQCYKNFVLFNHFDADGIWEAQPVKIPNGDISSVSLKNRYIRIYSKYVKAPT